MEIFTKGKIDLGFFWYTTFWTFGFQDPPPPTPFKENPAPAPSPARVCLQDAIQKWYADKLVE